MDTMSALNVGEEGWDSDDLLNSLLPPAVLLGLATVANVSLILCLRHTWNRWSQVKWYIVLLTTGNLVDTVFSLTTQLAIKIQHGWEGGDIACKVFKFLDVAGTSLANMATAALALHVLLTSLTGYHGNNLRHILLGTLFSLLSLPFPASKIVLFKTSTVFGPSMASVCTDAPIFEEWGMRHLHGVYVAVGTILLVFLPLVLIVGALGGATIAVCSGYKGNGRSNSKTNTADLVLALMLGLVLMLCCAPLCSFILFSMVNNTDNGIPRETMVTIYLWLVHVYRSRVVVSAIVVVLFGYIHVYRKGEGMSRRPPKKAERQSLVQKLQAGDTSFSDDWTQQ